MKLTSKSNNFGFETSEEFFFTLMEAKGGIYRKFAKELKSWGVTMEQLFRFNTQDFERLGFGKIVRKGVLRLINAHKKRSSIEVHSFVKTF